MTSLGKAGKVMWGMLGYVPVWLVMVLQAWQGDLVIGQFRLVTAGVFRFDGLCLGGVCCGRHG